jgi:ATP-dependent helicase/nuclease subunit B
VQARFLLGPAGSGKTWRCLAEIRTALRVSPAGRTLILLAPKQATFQLERQLLADPELAGYVRLQILSFERLAGFVLERLGAASPELLSEDGRVMVLRALLAREAGHLRLFRAAARLTGFAQQLSLLLRELQHHQLSPGRLEDLARRPGGIHRLEDKLHDLAHLLRAYEAWLAEHQLQDAERRLDLATAALRWRHEPVAGTPRPVLEVGALWLDGFAEMTPQELDLVAALLPRCSVATLAFCLDPADQASHRWLSPWSVAGRTFGELRVRLQRLDGVEIEVEELPRDKRRSRFAGNPVLRHLESCWAQPTPFAGDGNTVGETLRVVACANPEAEAVFAARTILRFVREQGGRFREIAVLVRSLDAYHAVLPRAFARYEIPFFLDRREAVGHHPLAELTRHALRTVAFDWQPDDWFGALKSGLVSTDESGLDLLENMALARGWKRAQWLAPIRLDDEAGLERRLEPLRQRVVAPFAGLAAALKSMGGEPAAEELVEALRALWKTLGVEATLTAWSTPRASETAADAANRVHLTVWEQVNALLDNLVLAFRGERMPLTGWLPILEAGLANLTVGVIPPALDQVLIGAVDRSRNPDLRRVLLLGINDGVFPALPGPALILTRADREALAAAGVELDPDPHRHIGRERYYGYIAATRARDQVIATFSRRDADDRVLNPSPFVAHWQRLFPRLKEENWPSSAGGELIEHGSELIAPLLRAAAPAVELPPSLAAVVAALRQLPALDASASLSPALAARLHGPVLHTSVSRLELFAACPFRFFVHSGLRAEERKRFEVDARERGSFQHDVLRQFHEAVQAEGRRWRDLTPGEARERIGRIAADVACGFGEGLFQAEDRNLFTAHSLTLALQDFIETVVGWMRGGYRFDPVAAELAFGGRDAALPAWEIDLEEGHRLALRGLIDRVDIAAGGNPGEAFAVVVDYKSSQHQVDPVLLANGVQLQLPAYAASLRRIVPAGTFGAVTRLVPVGVFYVNLRSQPPPASSRRDVLGEEVAARGQSYQHRGRFSVAALPLLDQNCRTTNPSGQFACRLKRDGQPYANCSDPLPAERFAALLDQVEGQLQHMGREILAGAAQVDPYRKGATESACDRCEYQSLCRIEPTTHNFRRLEAPPD